jgi:hypothetical protein
VPSHPFFSTALKLIPFLSSYSFVFLPPSPFKKEEEKKPPPMRPALEDGVLTFVNNLVK